LAGLGNVASAESEATIGMRGGCLLGCCRRCRAELVLVEVAAARTLSPVKCLWGVCPGGRNLLPAVLGATAALGTKRWL